MENYYKTLPDGYKEALVFDARKGKKAVILNIVAVLLCISVAAPFFIFSSEFLESWRSSFNSFQRLAVILGCLIYLILHELIHGFFYKVMTHQKLKFGLSLMCAYCGVPDIYTSRKTALISTSAPFILFTVIFIPLIFYCQYVGSILYPVLVILFSIHVGGCAGDLYVICLFLLKYKDHKCLMNDTGPKMTIYVPE